MQIVKYSAFWDVNCQDGQSERLMPTILPVLDHLPFVCREFWIVDPTVEQHVPFNPRGLRSVLPWSKAATGGVSTAWAEVWSFGHVPVG